MANLVSPGISVTITDESFFIPASAPTVPLIFIATADEKLQPDGLTPAAGTYEYDVVRTVTSVRQSLELYGTPVFMTDTTSGDPKHGDARNEYGLFALNQFLGVGNRAFVVRANVNLNDELTDIRTMWDAKIADAATYLETLIDTFIQEYNDLNGYTAYTVGDAGYQDVDLGASAVGTNVAVGDASVGNFDFLYTVDGGSVQTATVALTGTETFDDLVTLMSNAMTDATASLVSGDIRITSDNAYTTAGTSAILLGHGTVNPDLFQAPTSGLWDVDFLGTLVGTNAAGPVANTYDINVTVDGVGPTNVSITLLGTETVQDVIDALNAQFTTLTLGVTASIAAGDLRFTSSTSGETSSMVVAAGTTLDLLAAMTGYNAIGGAVDGVGGVVGYVGLGTPVAGTGSPFKETVTGSELRSLMEDATDDLFSLYSFTTLFNDFFDDQTAAPLDVFGNGYDMAATGSYDGLGDGTDTAIIGSWTSGSVVADEFIATEGSGVLVAAADDFKYTVEFKNGTSLGANDAARRTAITTALQATINSNTEVRSENYEYNLVLCPGYPEVVDELLSLVVDINEEAFVIADTPMDNDPADTVTWAGTTARQNSTNVAYYYPHSYASNIDGANVLAAASGTALRTFAYSDNVSELWFPPAGTRRGLVSGVTDVGYVVGQLGSATTFTEAHLNPGQRDDLYKYFTNVNPIVYFPGRGIIVWGQKTSATDASALDRVNVSRLIKYIKRSLRKNTMPFVFEPNDQLTRDNVKAAVDGFLGDLVIKRGLYDFATVCDESNNTPERIDNNELYIDVAIKPVKAAEFIYIPIRIVATGAEI